MTASVIVATPHQAFGELLRLSLEEEGRYRVHLVQSAREAADLLTDEAFDIAIIDGELKDMLVSELGRQMLIRTPGLKVVLIPPDNDPRHPSLAGMVYHGYILRPFYLPDLLDMMESLSGAPSHALQPAAPPAASAGLDADQFDQAFKATSALAGVVLVGNEQYLTRGDLPDAVAAELETLVGRALSNGERTDLVRFVRLSGQPADHLFYITPVSENTALGLAYTVGTPLSRVRVQAGQVADVLRRKTPNPGASAPAPAVAESAQALLDEQAPDEDPPEEDADPEILRDINLAALLGAVPPPDPGSHPTAGWAPEISMSLPRPESETLFPWDENERQAAGAPGLDLGVTQPLAAPATGETAQVLEATRLAAEAPAEALALAQPESEQPGSQPVADAYHGVKAGSPDLDVTQVVAAPPAPAARPVEDLNSPAAPVAEDAPEPAPDVELTRTTPVPPPVSAKIEPSAPPAAEAVAPQRAKTAPLRAPQAAFSIEEPPVDELEDTRPRVPAAPTNLQQLAPSSSGYSLLSYTCVLIPRLPQHHLTGGLGGQTGQWVQQLCLAFGWRLEAIAIRPEYLQWTVQVSPSIAPANLIRILRARISESIFENFPSLARQNPSGDFWATGYLIVSGMQPPSPRLLRDYIAETRRRQGLNYPGGQPLVPTSSEAASLLDGSQAPFSAD